MKKFLILFSIFFFHPLSAETFKARFMPSFSNWEKSEKNLIENALSKVPSKNSRTIDFLKIQMPLEDSSSYYFKETADGRILYFINLKKFSKLDKTSRDFQISFKRNAIESLINILDKENNWSSSTEWLSINRWKKKNSEWFRFTDKSGNKNLDYFLNRKIRTPRENLSVFLSFYLTGENPDTPHDETLKCRYLSESRYSEKIIMETDPKYISFYAKYVPSCPAFENWAKTSSIKYFEIILAAPSSVFIGSLFGHVFLRAYSENSYGLPASLTGRTFGFMAETYGLIENDPFYNFKGIFGLYRSIVIEKDFSEFFRQYVVYEDRDMKRWRLNLTPSQKVNLMERIYEMSQNSSYPYYFFSDNCGTFLFDLISGTLASDGIILSYPDSTASIPTATIDGYLQGVSSSQVPLLTPLEPIPGYKTEMVRARQKITHLLSQIRKKIIYTENSFLRKRYLESISREIFSKKESIRKNAYQSVILLSDDHPEISSYAKEILSESIYVEAYFAVRQNVKKEKEINIKRIKKLKKDLSNQMKDFCIIPDNFPENKNSPGLISECLVLKSNLKEENPAVRIKNYRDIESFTRLLDEKGYSKWKNQIIYLTVLHSIFMYDLSKLLATSQGRDLYSYFIDNLSHKKPFKESFNKTKFIYVSNTSENQRMLTDFSGFQEASLNTVKVKSYFFSSRTGMDTLSIAPSFLNYRNNFLYGLSLELSLIDEKAGEFRISGFPYYISMEVLKNKLFLAPRTKSLFYRDYFTFFHLRFLDPDTSRFHNGYDVSFSMDSENPDQFYSSRSYYGGSIRGGLILPLVYSNNYRNYIFITPGIHLREFSYPDYTGYFYSTPIRIETRIALIPLKSGLSHLSFYAEYSPFWNVLDNFFYHSFSAGLTLFLQISDSFRFEGSKTSKSLRFFIDLRYHHIYHSINIHLSSPEELSLSAGFRLN